MRSCGEVAGDLPEGVEEWGDGGEVAGDLPEGVEEWGDGGEVAGDLPEGVEQGCLGDGWEVAEHRPVHSDEVEHTKPNIDNDCINCVYF